VVVAHGIPEQAIAVRIAESLCQAIARPFELEQGAVQIGTSLGIALSTLEASSHGGQLLTDADNAMYEAKRRGRNGYRFATDSH
jgi:GGDEF domain-containing protein